MESSGGDGPGEQFRLAGLGLRNTLLRARAGQAGPRADEQALAWAFLMAGQETGWDRAPAYLLRSLPAHAARAGLIDELLTDDGYLLHADRRQLQPLAGPAVTRAGRERGTLLRLASRDVLAAGPASRAAMFSVTEALEGLPPRYAESAMAVPYRAAWAVATPSADHAVLRGHGAEVTAACAFTRDGVTYLASSSADATVRIWDPATGDCLRTLTGHEDWITAACAFTLDGVPYLATASGDHTARVWDLATGDCQRILRGHDHWVMGVCAFTLDGTAYLATASDPRSCGLLGLGEDRRQRLDRLFGVGPVGVHGCSSLSPAASPALCETSTIPTDWFMNGC